MLILSEELFCSVSCEIFHETFSDLLFSDLH